ncbi:MAG: NPCBM/NEW2 domain-containing protein [Candidatus Hydrogenedentes bacterium]|nr:NPCBM/NEW2 domain-containing protein [Candidatus Hydrogenedentota bacterium]
MNTTICGRFVSALLLLFALLLDPAWAQSSSALPTPVSHPAPAPLFVDPVFDGAADPTIVWNRAEGSWWIFYTARRANQKDEPGVRWCHGTDIGIAVSKDAGASWTYGGIAKGLNFEEGRNTFWAPEVLWHDGQYHMFVSYIRGLHDDWSGQRHIVHYTSANLADWKFVSQLALSSDNVIDPCVYRLPDGTWRMWYKDEADNSHIYAADSPDLLTWTVKGPVITDRSGEAPNVFLWNGVYWMITDAFGLSLYRSKDADTWTYVGPFMREPGQRRDDGGVAQHVDVWVQGEQAYIVYFTHPYGKQHVEPDKHRSVLQVAPLSVKDGVLEADRDTPFEFVLQPPDRWTLATDDTRITFGVEADRPVVYRLEDTAGKNIWIESLSDVPLMSSAWANGSETALHWRFVDGAVSAEDATVVLTFHNDSPKLQLKSCWRARQGRGPVEQWITLENQSSGIVSILHQDSLTLSGLRPNGEAEVRWIKRGGGNASTQGGTVIEPVRSQLDLTLISNCDDGASPVPWLAVQSKNNCGLYVGWEFSGLGRIAAKSGDGAAMNLSIGLLPEFRTDIEPGEVFQVPPAFVGCYTGDIDDGSYSLHQWILRYLRPKLPDDIPDPILAYNLYLDAGGPTAKEADVLRSAEFCRDIGFEAFMPDAMWFPACGDWRWDPARFPNGIAPIEQFVHNSGMRLALWCAWTNGGVSEDAGALSVRGPVGHPDWFDSDFNPDWQPGPFYGGRVCLACPEAKQWETEKTQWLVSNHKLDYLKHDCGPIVTQCNKTTHRHRYGVDASYWATMGYYDVQEKLRAAYPRIILENCSGGGHIKDFGIIQRTHYTVTTDTLSNLPDRQSIYDSTFAIPPMILQAYTYERNYHVPGDDPGSYLWRSAMMGAWQIDPTNTRIWTDEEKDSARSDAQIYKDWVRPMLKDAQVHHILPRPDGVHWDGMFYWSPNLKRGTLYIFRPDSDDSQQTVRLKGLEPAGMYRVWCEDGSVPVGEHTGADLMQAGLAIGLQQRYSSDLIFLQDASLPKPDGLVMPGAFQLGEAEVKAGPFDTSVTLTWTPSAHARKYRIQVARSLDGKDAQTKVVSGLHATFSNLSPETGLCWSVTALSWGGRRNHDGPLGEFVTPKLEALDGISFVSDMEWLQATAGAGNEVHRDTNYSGGEIHIAGTAYPKSIWMHAFDDTTPADLVVSTAGKDFSIFVADVGVEDSGGSGSVQFQVLADGAVMAESSVLRSGQSHHFEVDVKGAREVTLRVLNGGDGFSCDHSAWGNARFVKAGSTDPLGFPSSKS